MDRMVDALDMMDGVAVALLMQSFTLLVNAVNASFVVIIGNLGRHINLMSDLVHYLEADLESEEDEKEPPADGHSTGVHYDDAMKVAEKNHFDIDEINQDITTNTTATNMNPSGFGLSDAVTNQNCVAVI